MPFDSLAYRHTISLHDLPTRWLPLINAYDPDLPLFPIYYFHNIPSSLSGGHRPLRNQRVFGYIERINMSDAEQASATIISNKDLANPANRAYLEAAEEVVRERMGINNPVRLIDVEQAFVSPLDHANAVLGEIWERVVAESYGGLLPFGRLWDEVLGLARFVASWNSQSGRKGELIQTHYFASHFGERISAGGNIPQVDFFLLPTIREIQDPTNPLTHFDKFRQLIELATDFVRLFCTNLNVENIIFSKFTNPCGGRFNTKSLFQLIEQLNYSLRPVATECFNAFGKGPQRTIIFLLMLADLRRGTISPATLTSSQCGAIYDRLHGAYQSAKVLEIFSQQAFGNPAAMPIDTWIETFLQWPLTVRENRNNSNRFLFEHATNLGKVERLIWVSAQARKVHSSACHDALWCLKKSSGNDEADTIARGANPLACNICIAPIREACPAFACIKRDIICFNRTPESGENFCITTSANDNTTPNQTFLSCTGRSIYGKIVDDFSPRDEPAGFAPYPDPRHGGTPVSVDEFIRLY